VVVVCQGDRGPTAGTARSHEPRVNLRMRSGIPGLAACPGPAAVAAGYGVEVGGADWNYWIGLGGGLGLGVPIGMLLALWAIRRRR
jgi:hypothetical protein